MFIVVKKPTFLLSICFMANNRSICHNDKQESMGAYGTAAKDFVQKS